MFPEKTQTIFRLYDIRGVYGETLDPVVMTRIGLAVSEYLRDRYVVGSDVRSSSLPLKHALISGLLAGGSDVIDIGVAPIGAVMYATLHRGYAAAYVTASHLPPEWNGVKLFKKGGDPMVGDDIFRIRDLFFSDLSPKKPGYYSRWYIIPEYMEFLLSKASASGLKIVVDCGNGAAALLAPLLLREAGHEVYTINADPDPRFPGRGSEPAPDRLTDLRDEVIKRKANFGVAFDGDGDRTIFVDEKGRVLSAEQAAVIMLEGNGYGDVVANVECSMIIEEMVSAKGFKVFRVPVGRTFVVKEVVKRGAILGVESSGHYVVWKGLNMDDGLTTLLYFTEAASKLENISDVVPPQYPYVKVKVKVSDEHKYKVVEAIKELAMKKYEVSTIDGVRISFEDAWVLVRPSNTEPVVRITSEAKEFKRAKELAKKYADTVKKLAADLSRGSLGSQSIC